MKLELGTLFAAAALSGVVGAQAAPNLTGVHWSAASAESLWALGTTYKCGFSPEGATYVPYLGSSAPRNHPLDLRVESVTRGGVPIAFERAVAPVRDGERVSWDRGSFVEVYDLEPSAIEQSFVFERLPGEGDLLLRIAVQGDLTPGEKPEGLEFGNDLGTVRYGRATAIDAVGKRAPAPTRHAAGAIEIRVPQEFLADAVLPLVVDPIVTTFWVNLSADDTYGADVAFDAASNRMITVFERAFSASDRDIIASVQDASGFPHHGILIVDNSSEDWQHARVANHRQSGGFLVVAQAGPVGARRIEGQIVIAQGLFQSTTFRISPSAPGEQIHPTVGGDPSPTGTAYYCVAWERAYSPTDHDIEARLVDSLGGVSGANGIGVDTSYDTLDRNPSISKSNGMPPAATQDWTIVWQRRYAPGDEDIYGAQIHRDGSIANSTFAVENSALNTLYPSVSSLTDWGGNLRRYLVAWQREIPGPRFKVGMALRTGPIHLASGDLETLQDEFSPTDKVLPSVDTDGSSFALAYNELYGPDLGDVFLANVCVSGAELVLSERKAWLGHTLQSEMRPRIAAEHGSGGTGRASLVVWDKNNGLDHDIEAARYGAPTGGPIWGFCDGFTGCPCGNDATGSRGCANSVNPAGAGLTGNGIVSVSEDSFVLNGSGMLPHSTCIYLQGSTSSSPVLFGDGKICVDGSLIRLVVRRNSGGASSFPAVGEPSVSVRGQVPALGGTRSYQAWYRDPTNFCTATPYNITNGILAVWTP